jgi:hypothetical protein
VVKLKKMSGVKYRMKDLPKDERLRKFFLARLEKTNFYGKIKKWQDFIKRGEKYDKIKKAEIAQNKSLKNIRKTTSKK